MLPSVRDGPLAAAVASVCALLASRRRDRATPLVVALDGRSGAGKSTLARAVARPSEIAVVSLDDFFSASVPSAQWDAWTPAERARHVLDWTRIRTDVLRPLRAGRAAHWQPFDFAAGPRSDGSYGLQQETVGCAPAPVVVLEGAYAASPPLADLIDLAILVEANYIDRTQRLLAREDTTFLSAWHARWDAVEDHYATVVRPRATFDLVVSTSAPDAEAGPAAAV